MAKKTIVTEEQIAHQYEYMQFIARMNAERAQVRGEKPRAFTQTFGCQQNEADTERIAGMLREMGYDKAEKAEEADVIVINTCAVREHAESRALGNVGALSHLKKARPEVTICLCGCMVQQAHMPEKIKKSYPQVDLVFGTHALWRFPELLYRRLTGDKRVFDTTGDEGGYIAEGLPVLRDGGTKAWLSIMYGCNNFCTYCIVPYVRGRERSRSPEEIEAELRQLVAEGYKDITLLGQNVNSYGKDLEQDIDFSDLLRRLNAVPGDFLLRFMTSHPKDASHKLFDTMADCEKVAKQLHLPFQSGSDGILKRMNRGYTAAHYRELIAYAREKMPEITLSSDIIVGFPGETEEDFEQTRALVEATGFDMLYTFLYSRRSGTPAAEMEDNTPHAVKQARFERLLATQDKAVQPRQDAYLGRRLRVLVDGTSKGTEYPLTARTEGGLLVCCAGENLRVGEFAEVTIDKTSLRCLFGRGDET
ncbi:MAG: tRNA (N6-isopentenyl adenosine(37)-C2)-methylthiotransferase MiaB [Clostridiales bacterium]|nr:tRNA (N6-isopentenyl adenosine(37)-C2)-methylthiotransferase MiaB [Butyricicoccus pullicaecorum]MCI6720838.1 tRNA (N6-isopentenyl adenosine(37)-C2)-methylthiotransferase MiaB [Clostridiales bacterium]